MSEEGWLILVSFALIFLYHISFGIRLHRHPTATSLGITHRIRREWVQEILKDGRDLLGVQTLRNQVMAASFLASTAILISLGVLGLAANPSFYSGFLTVLGGSDVETAGTLSRLVLISVNFFAAFFNFTLCIRYYNHASFGVGLKNFESLPFPPEFILTMMDRGSLHYFLGMRGYYLSVPLLLWIMGPFWLFFGVLGLLFVLFFLDRMA
ncbi:DUF599 domain-containing protein [Desulfobotulus sp. H1]|uniref:DUF599 domain-containing protein n=1 Tax=Desulfobotulus pelophilus TaxID=2823377 RepID=A0ABT3NCS4_9BACT|nr:DUF599 domain-containing protein [Desulfobotulus pelophilus]MCW7755264.1 DUF599 domain-containing protein [Desulfobotulus pelophilus]